MHSLNAVALSLASFIFFKATAYDTVVQDGGSIFGQFVQYSADLNDDFAVQRYDPIISPSSIGGHVHQFFGASNLVPPAGQTLTSDFLRNSACTNVGSGSTGNAVDHSVYWVPALYMMGKNGSLVKLRMNQHKLYYQWRGAASDQQISPFDFPDNFRMIAGNTDQRAAQDIDGQIVQWICHGGPSGDKFGGFPQGVTTCTDYPFLNAAIQFPHCWNGQDFDESSPTAHMSYATGDTTNGPCPSSHPIKLPHIFIENQYVLDDDVASQVVADSFVLANGDTTGYGFHADFFNGWKAGAIETLMRSSPLNPPNEAIVDLTTYQSDGLNSQNCQPQVALPYPENDIDAPPGINLPGCNPTDSSNPASIYKAAPLNSAEPSSACIAVAPGDAHVNSGNWPDDGSSSPESDTTPAGSVPSPATASNGNGGTPSPTMTTPAVVNTATTPATIIPAVTSPAAASSVATSQAIASPPAASPPAASPPAASPPAASPPAASPPAPKPTPPTSPIPQPTTPCEESSTDAAGYGAAPTRTGSGAWPHGAVAPPQVLVITDWVVETVTVTLDYIGRY